MLAAAGVVVVGVCFSDRVVLHFLGWDGQTSDNYAAWSGSVPALATIAGMSTIVSGLWHHINCHVDGCYLIGRYPVAGGQYKVCRRHHPDEHVRRRGLTLQHIHRAHAAHQERQAA